MADPGKIASILTVPLPRVAEGVKAKQGKKSAKAAPGSAADAAALQDWAAKAKEMVGRMVAGGVPNYNKAVQVVRGVLGSIPLKGESAVAMGRLLEALPDVHERTISDIIEQKGEGSPEVQEFFDVTRDDL